MLTRREFNSQVALGTVALGTIAGAEFGLNGCSSSPPSVSTILTEINNILTFIAPLGDGIAAVIEIADPAIAPAVQAAVAIYDKAIPAIEALIAQWAAAAASAQPGILSQIQAAITALQADVTSIISSITGVGAMVLAEINSITSAILGEISSLLKAIGSLGAIGGTSAALGKMASQPKYMKLAGPSAKTRRSNLVAELQVPTGTNIDAPCQALAAKLAALPLK
jgi:hypothetical protein